MPQTLSRRHLLASAPLVGMAAVLPRAAGAQPESASATAGVGAVDLTYPTQTDAEAREIVGVSHFDLARVKELLARKPSLAKASWDWGYGDWESALGAASHVGNREIAELLIAHGARPDLFAAAMLGWLDTVKAMVAAQPGCQRIPGPHGITLLAHAKAGGEPAAAVVAYLESIGGADDKPAAQPLADADRDALLGTYRFGPGGSETLEVAVGKFGLTILRKGTSANRIVHLGERAFLPVGAPAARIRFTPTSGTATEVAIHDPDLVLVAKRETS